jgi:L-lysine 2,3-aminomutase
MVERRELMGTQENTSQLVIYQTEEGSTKLDVRFQDETVWLTQKLMAELFQTSTDNIGLHLKNIYAEQELDEFSTTKDFSVVRQKDNRQVSINLKHYNLEAIISVGYRVRSHTVTCFRPSPYTQVEKSQQNQAHNKNLMYLILKYFPRLYITKWFPPVRVFQNSCSKNHAALLKFF